MYPKYFKRIFDIIGAVLGLIITFPLLLVVGIWLSVINRGSPLFFQNRSGRNGKVFKIIKFKTMTDSRDENGDLLPDAERIHKMGEFLRATSIDELPQMINVLLGQMSFIGPRPLIEDYLPLYTNRHARRHEIRPGMSGWAQVNGRNTISWSQKFEYDIWYIDRVNMALDIKIVWLTIQRLVNRDGINPDKEAPMIAFDTYCQRFHQLENRYKQIQ
ncbi:sugar transferase [Bacteroides sp. 519]|uniref:sugar transferase n=1 Tax=Bacteroides sp. 519 TaxID=2302937 RepID=UPI0013D10604|nr:sugar transferase [Bacteroides sp. 519]NDV60218.1 sugar transferase [Bacteroides sp. 519]